MEYRSSTGLLGLPLAHVATGVVVDRCYRRGVATGWIAVGDIALGVRCACGAVSKCGLCLGGVAVCVVPLGGLALLVMLAAVALAVQARRKA